MRNKTLAVIPGSYDPITNGHLDIIKRASSMYDEVIVLLCVNSSKRGFVDVEARKQLCDDAVKNINNVKVDVCGGLFAADFDVFDRFLIKHFVHLIKNKYLTNILIITHAT